VSLPVADLDYLNERGLPYSVSTVAGMICVVLPSFALPDGCNLPASDLLIIEDYVSHDNR
jgi:hypothetical protein